MGEWMDYSWHCKHALASTPPSTTRQKSPAAPLHTRHKAPVRWRGMLRIANCETTCVIFKLIRAWLWLFISFLNPSAGGHAAAGAADPAAEDGREFARFAAGDDEVNVVERLELGRLLLQLRRVPAFIRRVVGVARF